jgi:hypothetical protein
LVPAIVLDAALTRSPAIRNAIVGSDGMGTRRA